MPSIEARGQKRLALVATLIALAACLTWAPALWNGFVYDDHWLVERNPVARTVDPLAHFAAPFWSRWEQHVDPYYRPLTTLSVAVDRSLWGTRPLGFHLTNVGLHALNAILLFLALSRIGDRGAATLAAAWFAVHPLQAEGAAWVMGRNDLLVTTFVLLGLWLRVRGRGALVLGLAWAAALLSKESGVTFPAVILACDLALARRDGAAWRPALVESLKRSLRLAAVWVPVFLGYLVLRYSALGVLLGASTAPEVTWGNPLRAAGVGVRLLSAVHIAGRYLALLVWPASLSADYRPDVVRVVDSPWTSEFLVPAAACALVSALVVYLARRNPLALFGGLAGGATYLLVSHFVVAAPVIMAERLLYLPMIGVAAVFGAAVVELGRRLVPPERLRLAAAVAGALVLLPLAARSFARAQDWRDDYTLFRATVEATPQSALAWNNLGVELQKRGERDEALAAFETSLSIRSDLLSARMNHASTLRAAGQTARAVEELRATQAEFPEAGRVQLELVQALCDHADELERSGDAAGARALYEEALAGARAGAAAGEEAGPGMEAVFLLPQARALDRLARPDETEATYAAALSGIDRELAEGGAVPEVVHDVRAKVLEQWGMFADRHHRPLAAGQHWVEAAVSARAAGRADVASRLELDACKALTRADRAADALEACRRARAAPQAPTDEIDVAEARARAREGAIDPGADSPELLLAAAEGALEGGRADEALPLYDRVLAVAPDRPRALAGRARARLAAGDLDGAEADLERLLDGSIEGRPAAAAWTDLARVALGRSRESDALSRLDRAVAADPSYAEARWRRGTLRVTAGDESGAEDDLSAALRAGLPPAAAGQAWTHLARIARGRGDLAAARERARRALALVPDDPEARRVLTEAGPG